MKEDITKHSIQLFEQKGFSETSVQDIVDSVGVTKGTFYYYFKSKETLLMDIHLQYINNLLSRQQEVIEKEDTYRGKLIKNVELLIGDIETHGPSGRVFFREIRHLSPENIEEILVKRDEFRLAIEEILQEGVQSGEFRENLNPKMISFAVLGVTNWSYQWFNPAGDVSANQLASMFSDFILHGIQSEGD
ncbi:TetR/AcrR family transcriptional regulator [Sporosarcina sp. 179-K 3D1 HS]|uniref:TetR/AcrR family transcriptional regulator n=1 Tax=Sporosarcina sp. 179-K 3D1 HS TaxID=3232169 RepID=UPI0039A09924